MAAQGEQTITTLLVALSLICTRQGDRVASRFHTKCGADFARGQAPSANNLARARTSGSERAHASRDAYQQRRNGSGVAVLVSALYDTRKQLEASARALRRERCWVFTSSTAWRNCLDHTHLRISRPRNRQPSSPTRTREPSLHQRWNRTRDFRASLSARGRIRERIMQNEDKAWILASKKGGKGKREEGNTGTEGGNKTN